MKNRSKNGVKMGRHLGIDFLWILVDFWRQVGEENGAKIDPRRHRKSDGKVDSVKIAKKLQQAVTTLCETRGPEPWGGGRGRGKPLPEGRGEGGRGLRPVHHAKPPQPRGLVGFPDS